MANEPVIKVRKGRVTATVFKNEVEGNGKKFTKYSVKVEKNYTVEENGKTAWKSTNNFDHADLPKVSEASMEAYNKVFELQGEKAE